LHLFSPGTNHREPVAFPVFLASVALVFWLVLRLVLWVNVGPTQMSAVQSASAFALGFWFDAWTLAYLITPCLFISALIPNAWHASRIGHGLRWTATWLVVAGLLFGAVAEFVFWQEFTTRFNFIAVDYLIYTDEVIGNIRESYPVPLILAGIGMLACIIVWLCFKRFSFKVAPLTLPRRVILLVLAIALPITSYTLANVDQTEVTENAYANELSGNGLFSLAAAMRRNELDYDRFYKTIPQQDANTTLTALGMMRPPLSANGAQREGSPASNKMGPFTRRPKNVVLISVESLSADYLGIHGGQKGLTPNLDKLAAEGLQFDRLFATGTRTVRGLDALSLGTPPIPGQAIVHRPDNEHLATIGELLKAQGYATYFIYGGYGYFDNMNAYFRGNNYQVIDRTDFDPKTIAAENIWGVADESLFDNALTALDESTKSGKPFFAHIMTTSNHRPFTFPEGRIDLPQGSRDGAVKYTDYALGRLIEQAKTKPWFKDTLFVIVADHCASVAGKTKLPVAKYHIPLIFYAPDMLKPAHYSRMASQIDIAPTLLDVLGAQGKEHFFGESLFAAEAQPARAFISNYQELGYYKNDTLIVLSPKKKAEAFKINPKTYEAEKSAIDATLLQEAIAYYQTGSRAFKQGALKINTDESNKVLVNYRTH
jgi:phosphoglycerol transferase MdoB-like AlkP superfamily enzyme